MEFWVWVILAVILYFWLAGLKERRQKSQRASATAPYLEREAWYLRAASDPHEDSIKCWVPPGQTVTVAGHEIPCGMLYVGTRLTGPGGYGNDNCLINPRLRIARSAPDREGKYLSYYPSYEGLPLTTRLAYLEWLSSDRSDPTTPIGYVFMYFYGLERRLIFDQAAAEAASLIAEVKRLRGIYGGNYSFDHFSRALIDTAEFLFSTQKFYEREPEFVRGGWDVPLSVKLAIGQLIADRRPVPWDWMLVWLYGDPYRYFRTPARRADVEFRSLFRLRFNQKYANGIPIRRPQQRFALIYRFASNGSSVEIGSGNLNLPDISGVGKPPAEVREIAEGCIDDLDSYSRFLGRHPEKRKSARAYALLPQELRQEMKNSSVKEIEKWLGGILTDRCAVVPSEKLAEKLGLEFSGKWKARELRAAAMILRAVGVGIEPDLDLGGRTVSANQAVALFRLPAGPMPESLSREYGAASLVLGLAAVVAHADSQVQPEEEEHLAQHIESALHLTDHERLRLEAYLKRMLAVPEGLSSFRSRLKEIRPVTRRKIAQVAVMVATADGHVDPAEIKLLQRIYKHLELDPKDVFSHLHFVSPDLGPADEPVTIRPAIDGGGRYKIPEVSRRKSAKPLKLDAERVQRILDDTRRISAVLGEVFKQQDDAEPTEAGVGDIVESEDGTAMENVFPGLDPQVRFLVHELLERTKWPRADFERLARSLDLLPDGAIETVNEWAFERYEDALIEEDDPLIINTALVPRQQVGVGVDAREV